MIPNVLSIAGSDPSGGAGIQADLKTFAALGVYGMAALSALTAQNTRGVTAIHRPPADFMRAQLEAIFSDIKVHAVKIGMLGDAESIKVVGACLKKYRSPRIVFDPVMVATSGDSLSDDDSVRAMREHLLPLAHVITPNIPEAEILLGRKYDGNMEDFAARVLALGVPAVLLKGGHLKDAIARDVLAVQGQKAVLLDSSRIDTKNTHGTGCTLSSALAAYLARGEDLESAAGHAKAFVTRALEFSGRLDVGKGHGPLYHGYTNDA